MTRPQITTTAQGAQACAVRAVLAAIIDRSCDIKGNAHGRKNADRDYPLISTAVVGEPRKRSRLQPSSGPPGPTDCGPRRQPWVNGDGEHFSPRQRATESCSIISVAPAGAPSCACAFFPWLSPWATFCRRYAACLRSDFSPWRAFARRMRTRGFEVKSRGPTKQDALHLLTPLESVRAWH